MNAHFVNADNVFICEKEERIYRMKINRKFFGRIAGVLALVWLGVFPVCSADGDPDAKQEVRNVEALAKLKDRKQVSLLYVKGMT